MYKYDIRKQIKMQNRKKLFGETCVILVVVAVILIILSNAELINPFRLREPGNDRELQDACEQGIDFINLKDKKLKFTGYYKKDSKERVIYNCYIMKLGEKNYFVFVPPARSGSEKPKEELYHYSFEARLQDDKALFEMAAQDHDMSEDEFIKSYEMSSIVLNEAKAGRREIAGMWILSGIFLLTAVVYGIIAAVSCREPERNKAVRRLRKSFGDIDKALDEINQEVDEALLFDSNNVKITEHWLLYFDSTNTVILLRDELEEAVLKDKMKKQYGFVNIGKEYYVVAKQKNGRNIWIAAETEQDGEEIKNLLLKK